MAAISEGKTGAAASVPANVAPAIPSMKSVPERVSPIWDAVGWIVTGIVMDPPGSMTGGRNPAAAPPVVNASTRSPVGDETVGSNPRVVAVAVVVSGWSGAGPVPKGPSCAGASFHGPGVNDVPGV